MRNIAVVPLILGLLIAPCRARAADPICGDVNRNGILGSTDALRVLRAAVGLPENLQCPPLATPLRTGETRCYDEAGGVIACSGTGQAGAIRSGVGRVFTETGGTVLDERTGLYWENLSDDGSIHDRDDSYTWTQAFSVKIATLNSEAFAGYSDWRMPNRFELETLLDLGNTTPATYPAFNRPTCLPGCSPEECNCTKASARFWTASTSELSPELAWTVLFATGESVGYSKTSTAMVRAVRGGE